MPALYSLIVNHYQLMRYFIHVFDFGSVENATMTIITAM